MRIKPDIDQAVILREAGYTLASITQKTGLSGSTLYRAFTKLDVTRGTTTKNTLDSAKQALLEQSGLVGDLKYAFVLDFLRHLNTCENKPFFGKTKLLLICVTDFCS